MMEAGEDPYMDGRPDENGLIVETAKNLGSELVRRYTDGRWHGG